MQVPILWEIHRPTQVFWMFAQKHKQVTCNDSIRSAEGLSLWGKTDGREGEKVHLFSFQNIIEHSNTKRDNNFSWSHGGTFHDFKNHTPQKSSYFIHKENLLVFRRAISFKRVVWLKSSCRTISVTSNFLVVTTSHTFSYIHKWNVIKQFKNPYLASLRLFLSCTPRKRVSSEGSWALP